MQAISCGIEAEMFGNLMILASGALAKSPSSERWSAVFCSAGKNSERLASTRPARDMSRVSTATPAAAV